MTCDGCSFIFRRDILATPEIQEFLNSLMKALNSILSVYNYSVRGKKQQPRLCYFWLKTGYLAASSKF